MRTLKRVMRRLLSEINNEDGMTLALVLMVIVVFTVLGMGLLSVAATNTKLTTVDRSNESAYYIAEAGATYKLNEIQNVVNSVYTKATDANGFFAAVNSSPSLTNVGTYTSFSKDYGASPVARASISSPTVIDNTTQQYKVTSIGKIGNQTRTVSQTITVKYIANQPQGLGSLPKVAVYGATRKDSTITLEGSSIIGGDLATNATITPSIFLNGNTKITGAIEVNPSVDLSKPVVSVGNQGITIGTNYQQPTKLTQTTSFPDPVSNFPAIPSGVTYPDQLVADSNNPSSYYNVVQNGNVKINDYRAANYTLDLTKNASAVYTFNTVEIDSNYNLTINVGSTDRTIVINHLNINTGSIKLLGTGNLTVYIVDQFTMGSSSTFNDGGDVNRLRIYYKGPSSPDTLTFSGGQKIIGSLYAKQANVHITAGAGFTGPIVTGGTSFVVDGGTSSTTQLFYAPNADFKLLNGASINGKVVCKTYYGSGNSLLNYTDIPSQSIPFTMGSSGGSISSGSSTLPANLFSVSPLREAN